MGDEIREINGVSVQNQSVENLQKMLVCHTEYIGTACLVIISADDILKYFSYFFPENGIWHIMQIVSNGDNLHEMSNPVSAENKKKKIFQYVVC